MWFRAVGISCLTLLILGIVGMWFVVRMVSKRPDIRNTAYCQINLQETGGALKRYHERNGKYPQSLAALYPDFLEKKSMLHCPADTASADSISYEYHVPAENAPKDTVVCICRRHMVSVIGTQTRMALVLQKDGTVLMLPADAVGDDGLRRGFPGAGAKIPKK